MNCPRSLCIPFRAALSALFVAFLFGCKSKEEKIAEFLSKAETLMESGQLQEAKEPFEEALSLDHNNKVATDGLARIGEGQGRLRLAYQTLDKLKELDPEDPRTRVRLALLFLRARQFDQAQAECTFALSKEPNDSDAILIFADATDGSPSSAQSAINYLKTLDLSAPSIPIRNAAYGIIFSKIPQYYERAERFYQKALQAYPENPYILNKHAQLLRRTNRPERANESFLASTIHANGDPSFFLEYSLFKKSETQLDQARAILTQGLSIAKQHLPSLVELCKLELETKHYDSAALLVDRILGIDEDHPSGLSFKAKLNRLNNNPVEAVNTLEYAAGLYPRSANIRLELGLAYLATNQTNKAISSLRTARLLGSEPSEINILIAGANFAQEDFTEATVEIREFLGRNPEDTNMWLFLAETLIQKGSLDQAIDIYRDLISKGTEVPSLLYKMGLVQLQEKQLEEAHQSFYQSYKRSDSTFLPACEQLVRIELVRNRTNQALALLDAHEERNEITSKSTFLRGLATLQSGQAEQAQKLFKQAIELDPENAAPYFSLAEIATQQKRFDDAISHIHSYLSLEPQNLRALMTLGDLHEQKQELETAIAYYRKARDIAPDNAPAMNNLAYLYSKTPKTLEQAYNLANKARQLYPVDPIIADTLGWIVYLQGNYKWATPILQGSASSLRNRPEANYHYAKALYAMGEAKEAKSFFEIALSTSNTFHESEDASLRLSLIDKYLKPSQNDSIAQLEGHLKIEPTDPIATIATAKHYRLSGDPQKAIKVLEKALEKYPDNGYLIAELANGYQERGDTDQAFELAKRAYSIVPENSDVLKLLGTIAYQQKQHAWSNVLLLRAKASFPKDPELHFLLARSCLAVGKITQAIEFSKQALSLGNNTQELLDFIEITQALDSGTENVEARTRAKQVLERNGESLPALLYFAEFDASPDQPEAAIDRYKQILAVYQDCFIAKREIALIEAAISAKEDKEEDL